MRIVTMKSKFQVGVKAAKQRQRLKPMKLQEPVQLLVREIVHMVSTNEKGSLKYGSTSKMLKKDLFDAYIVENNTRWSMEVLLHICGVTLGVMVCTSVPKVKLQV
jgi:hypothetical protein